MFTMYNIFVEVCKIIFNSIYIFYKRINKYTNYCKKIMMEDGREDGARKNFWKIYLCQLFFLRLSLR